MGSHIKKHEVAKIQFYRTRLYPNQSGSCSSHQVRYSAVVAKERYEASSKTGLYVLMNAYFNRT